MYQSENELELKLIEKLERQGYSHIEINDYDALVDNFKIQIEKFNNIELTEKEFNRIKTYVEGKTVYQCAKQLRDQFVLERDDGSTKYIRFLSKFEDENIYQVTNQVTVEGKYTNRYDVTILCNGLPIVQIELKRAGVDIREAINQIDRYRIHRYKGLFHYVQIFVVSNRTETKYFANTDDQRITKSLTFYWANKINDRINNLSDFAEDFLAPAKLNGIINKYMVLIESEKNLIVMRPYQIYATEAIVNEALNTKNNGFVFACTGSGKSLIGFKTAQILCESLQIKKIFFLVDRADLDTQTTQEFNRFEPGCIDTTDKTTVLVKQIEDKNTKLICTTIQKMANAVKGERYSNVMNKLKDEKVIFIIDECHRTQFGKMHNDIKHHFKNAQYFGLTGTPRYEQNKSQDGRTTADIFGKCLFSYMIKDGIFDHNVLGFNIEYIKTYEGQYDETDKSLVEGIDTKGVLESDERISMVANHIVQHYKMKSCIGKNKYTALFAVSSIPMLIRYYDEFKKINHNLKIAAIFSYGTNEDLEDAEEHSRDALQRIMDDYNKMFETGFTTDTYAAYNADVSKRLKVKKTPEIDLLIVVNMYLTGFDAKPLNTLYVDKNLEWHTLLQAFSRTNRVEKETKQFGNIVCYRNLKKQTNDALTLFSGGGDIDGILLKPYEYYLDKFKETYNILSQFVTKAEDIDKLYSEDDKKKFVISFRELSKTLLTLQTFVDFEWKDIENCITQQTYEDIKGRYFTIYDEVTKQRNANKVSILNDIDFNVDLIETDRINVAYIMNLLKNINFQDKESKEKDIKHIFDELDRTDSPQLKRKISLIKKFLDEKIDELNENDSINGAYIDFEEAEREREITEFASDNKIEKDKLHSLITDYEFSEIIDNDFIDTALCDGLGFLQKRRLRQKIEEFVIDNCTRYASYC